MRFRAKPRTINAELLAEMPREARQETRDANSGDGDSRSRLRWLAACAAGVLFVIGLKWVVEVLPAWAQVVAGIETQVEQAEAFCDALEAFIAGRARG